jgi:hypothetical protein
MVANLYFMKRTSQGKSQSDEAALGQIDVDQMIERYSHIR